VSKCESWKTIGGGGLLGDGWCFWGRDSWGWETHQRRVFVINLGESWETKREDP